MSQTRTLEWIAVSFSRGSSRPWSPALQVDSSAPEPPGKFKASAYSLELVTELRRTFDVLDYPCGRKGRTQEPPEGRGAEGAAPPEGRGAEGAAPPEGRGAEGVEPPEGRGAEGAAPPEGRGAEAAAPPHLAGGLSQLLQGSPNPNCFQSSPFRFYGGIKM